MLPNGTRALSTRSSRHKESNSMANYNVRPLKVTTRVACSWWIALTCWYMKCTCMPIKFHCSFTRTLKRTLTLTVTLLRGVFCWWDLFFYIHFFLFLKKAVKWCKLPHKTVKIPWTNFVMGQGSINQDLYFLKFGTQKGTKSVLQSLRSYPIRNRTKESIVRSSLARVYTQNPLSIENLIHINVFSTLNSLCASSICILYPSQFTLKKSRRQCWPFRGFFLFLCSRNCLKHVCLRLICVTGENVDWSAGAANGIVL